MSAHKFKRHNIRVFIGSSSESKEIAENLQAALDGEYEATVWDQNIFGLGSTNIQSLCKATKEYDFAILVFAADDKVRKRHTEKPIPRDNVVFESGLFMGALGAERTFIVFCPEDKVGILSDLGGFTMAPFHRRTDDNIQAAVTPAVLKIRNSIRRLGPHKKQALTENHGIEMAFRHQADAVRSVVHKFAGVKIIYNNPTSLKRWARNVLGMLWDSFVLRQQDVYVAWLRPVNTQYALEVYWEKNLKKVSQHHPFKFGEGLVGKVWQEGSSASTSPMRAHKWWVYREGCGNITYLCACVGKAGGNGGVLAVGSDTGFELYPGDEERVAAFAALLEIAQEGLPITRKLKDNSHE